MSKEKVASRVAWASSGVNVALGLLNLAIAAASRIERQEVLLNPHAEVEKAKGIRVAEWLVGHKADVVVLREDVQGKGPAYVFADAGVETRLTQANSPARSSPKGR